jgi:hypothetical protein
MKIGLLALTVAAARPVNLDAQLVATTGCASREIGVILSAGADRAAHALAPFLEAPVPEHRVLANAIAADPTAITAIADLYSALATDIAPDDIDPAAIVAAEDVDHG